MTILVTGHIDVDPAKRDDFIAAAKALTEPTRQEDGCELYVYTADLDDPGRFYVSERWRDQAAVDSHMASPHMAAFFGAVPGVVTGAEVMKWDGATGSKLM